MPSFLSRGWWGELNTKIVQMMFMDSCQYHNFNDVLIRTNRYSSQIDHIVVSRYGLFVIETKRRGGWIFGSPDNEYWTQVLRKRKIRFQNPLKQNSTHIKNLTEFLSIKEDKIQSVVIFWGECQFKTPMPQNVIKGGLFYSHVNYIKRKTDLILTDEEVESICHRLQSVVNDTTRLDKYHHIELLKEHYKNTTTCPKCGGRLLERSTVNGTNPRRRFLGCENFPRCRYTKSI